MAPTGIVRDTIYTMHDMGAYHPESPRRLEVLYALVDDLNPRLNLETMAVREADHDELALIHAPGYIRRIESTSGERSTFLDPDTSTNAYSWEAAIKAVGGLLSLVDGVVDGRIRNGVALVRPPGHHAEHDRAMGFCLFNNIAIAARYAMTKHKLQRIAIVDWDLHHGNGTQNSFYDDPGVLFISTHQYPHYPGSGSIGQIGGGVGKGYTVNVPFIGGAGDKEYAIVFHHIVLPVLRMYKPELILVSAGFDAHRKDPLGGMELTRHGYGMMTQALMHAADELCGGRLVVTLEGGYNLDALRNSVDHMLTAMATYDPSKSALSAAPEPNGLHPRITDALRDIFAAQKGYWKDIQTF